MFPGVGRVSRSAVVAWAMVSLAGCAAISGLGSIQDEPCAPNCGADGNVVGPDGSQVDTGGSETSPGDDVVSTDSSSGGDTLMTMDTSVVDSPTGMDQTASDSPTPTEAGAEGGVEGGKDTGVDAIEEPPPFDSGCGALNTTTQCGGCTNACMTQASPGSTVNGDTCAGGNPDGSNDYCSYTCKSGHLDCDGTMPPNLNGCECAVGAGVTQSQCCGTMTPAGNYCPYQHNTGEGQTFWDCVPDGTYNQQLAMDACTAYTGNASQCNDMYTFDCISAMDADLVDEVCNNGSTQDCVCWGYDKTGAGLVAKGTGSFQANMQNCPCVLNGGSSWQ
jgi:hypothetical protein